MAGPLQELLQGLQQRRQRRRSGWGGGEAPGMRDMINPLDSQGMSDRAQGVDISSAMPPARLEARMAPRQEAMPEEPQEEPTGGAAVTAQLTQGGRNPFQTAAGSNAREQPMQDTQCPGGVCRPQASSGGLDASQYGITLGPGERLVDIGGMAGGATASAAPATVAPAPGGATASAAPATASQAAAAAFSGLQKTFAEMANDPNGPAFAPLATSIMDQAIAFNTLANMAPDVASKHWYRMQGVQLGMEAINTMRAAVMQADERRRAAYAEKWQESRRQQLESGTLRGQLREAQEVLSGDMGDLDPDYLAAAYVNKQRQLASLEPFKNDQEMAASSEYQNARRTAHANRIAGYAAQYGAADATKPFGTEESRAKGGNLAWESARRFYGSMSYGEAEAEINGRFVPTYLREISEINASRPEGERASAAELQDQAQRAGLILRSHVYWMLNPQQGSAMSQQSQQQQAPAAWDRSRSKVPPPGWAAGGEEEDPFVPAEKDPSFVPSRAMLLNRR